MLEVPLLLLASLLPWQTTEPAALEGEALTRARASVERLAEGMRGVERLHADFVQEQHTLLLEEPLVTQGRLHLRKAPGCVVLDVAEPRPSVVRSDERSHQVYHPDRKRAERYLFESNEVAKSLLAVMTADLAAIEEAFRITGHEAGEEGRALVLRPREAQHRRRVDSLRLESGPEGRVLRSVSFVNGEGERTVLRLSKLRRVGPKSSSEERARERDVFDRPLPKDVEVVVHRVPRGDG